MKDWHVVGQVVVSLGDFVIEEPVQQAPYEGQVLTIRAIDIVRGEVGFVFEEIVNPIRLYACGYAEPAFWCELFRPVKPTSIESLRALTNPPPVHDDARDLVIV